MKNKKFNSAWIVIPILVVLLIGIGVYTRSHVSGTYYQKKTAKVKKQKAPFKKITFKDGNFIADNGKKGTYQLKEDKLEIKEKDGKKMVGNLSDNHQSFKLTGVKFTKDEK